MKYALVTAAGFAAAFMMAGNAAQAQQQDPNCTSDAESVWDMSAEEVESFYACMEDWMKQCYAQNGHDVASVYRDWTVTSTRPAVAGAHSNRLLQTFANDIAAEQYLKFETEGVEMPAGSVLAKESFALKDGKGVIGPLFIMTKLEEGASPETDDWKYSGLTNTGDEMRVSQSFCHDCHVSWEAQDMMAYPLEEVRVSN